MKTFKELLEEVEPTKTFKLEVNDEFMSMIAKGFKTSKHPFASKAKINTAKKTIEIPKMFSKKDQPFDFIDSVVDFPNRTHVEVNGSTISINESNELNENVSRISNRLEKMYREFADTIDAKWILGTHGAYNKDGFYELELGIRNVDVSKDKQEIKELHRFIETKMKAKNIPSETFHSIGVQGVKLIVYVYHKKK